jgi:hypothetical protein
MRVRITRQLSGNIDGIQLGRFITGLTYDVGTTLGSYLLADGYAVPDETEAPELVTEVRSDTRASKRSPRPVPRPR